MKKALFFICMMYLFSDTTFTKQDVAVNHKKHDDHADEQPRSKKVFVYFDPNKLPKRDMCISVLNSKTRELDRFVLTKNQHGLQIEIFEPRDSDEVTFFVIPCVLIDYANQPRDNRRHYNINIELDAPNKPIRGGEERLMQALSVSQTYSYKDLPKSIVLDNPLLILHDLLDCTC